MWMRINSFMTLKELMWTVSLISKEIGSKSLLGFVERFEPTRSQIEHSSLDTAGLCCNHGYTDRRGLIMMVFATYDIGRANDQIGLFSLHF